MQVQLHEAEHCMNDLAACKKSWFHNDRFKIILKWMETYHNRKEEARIKAEKIAQQEKLIPYPEEGDGMD